MGQRFDAMSPNLQTFIQQQQIFFVGTATCEGRVNISPKGMDSLRILGPKRVIWLNLTGSGNETAAHLLENDRMTLMFCAFNGAPMILRLYGHATIYHPRDAAWQEFIPLFPEIAGARQIIDLAIDLVQTSCGMSVPYFDFKEERHQLKDWAEKKGEDGIQQYWTEKNLVSLDGKPTQILDD